MVGSEVTEKEGYAKWLGISDWKHWHCWLKRDIIRYVAQTCKANKQVLVKYW